MAQKLTPGSSTTSVSTGDSGSKQRSLASIRANSGKKTLGIFTRKEKVKEPESWWKSLLVALLIALFIRAFFVEAFHIPSGSMKNTLLVGDYLFVNKVNYFFSSPKYFPFTTWQIPYFRIKTLNIHRGDVLVFEYPGDRDLIEPRERKINYIKRCIAIAGDTVQLINKQVYVNGKPMSNPTGMRYNERPKPKGEIDDQMFPKGAPWNRDFFGPLRIPKKGDVIPINKDNFEQWEVFIGREGHKAQIGNNGSVEIDGKPVTTYTVERNYLWMMGDNRDDSADSRFWGFAPEDNVVGSAMFIYWSWYHPPSDMGDGYDPEEEPTTHIRWDRVGHIVH